MNFVRRPWFALGALFAASLFICAFVVISAKAQFGLDEALGPDLDAGYIPTWHEVVDGMLMLGEVSSDDIVYDLGSGDGRIVIAAAKQRGARAIGIELNPKRIEESHINAKAAGVEDRVSFVLDSFFTADFSNATVVMLYLPQVLNIRLRPVLWEQLAVGTRVVSHESDMGQEWVPEKSLKVGPRYVYMWTITEENKRAAAATKKKK